MDIKKINEIIDKELEYAKEVNPQMALGMLRIRELLNKSEDDYKKRLINELKEKLEVHEKDLKRIKEREGQVHFISSYCLRASGACQEIRNILWLIENDRI